VEDFPMKRVLFVVPRFDPGRCGVTDYVMRLCPELESLGYLPRVYACGVIAATAIADQPDSPLIANPTLGHAIENFRPDVISLQMVPIAYAPPGSLSDWLMDNGLAGDATPKHLLYHELWTGLGPRPGIIGMVRRWIGRRDVVRFHRALAPRWTHTTQPYYQALLAEAGIQSAVLPLFSNIPDVRQTTSRVEKTGPDSGSNWILGIVGSVYRDFPIECVLGRLRHITRGAGLMLECRHAGRHGDLHGAQRLRRCCQRLSIPFMEAGEMPAAGLSAFIAQCDAGLVTTPPYAWQKSGSALAFYEHGIPLIVGATHERLAPGVHALNRLQANSFPLQAPLPGDRCPAIARRLASEWNDSANLTTV
jgi:hypothetical protein